MRWSAPVRALRRRSRAAGSAGGVAAIVAATFTLIAGALPLLVAEAHATPGLRIYNLDPTFGDPVNDAVWDPNFLPGFNGTPGVHIGWSDPLGGPGTLTYFVGPWANGTVAPYPHFAVGPQAFNFEEVPRTQVFRSPGWGDYLAVHQGFLPCAVNLGNYSVNASAALHPIYIGMNESGTNWTLRLNLHWNAPVAAPGLPADAQFEIVVTTTEPALGPGTYPRLVYTELLLWSSAPTSPVAGRPLGGVSPASDVVGHRSFTVDQLPSAPTNRQYTIPLSTYLAATLSSLGLPTGPALLSYVYLSAAGYNTHLSVSISGLWLESPANLCGTGGP